MTLDQMMMDNKRKWAIAMAMIYNRKCKDQREWRLAVIAASCVVFCVTAAVIAVFTIIYRS